MSAGFTLPEAITALVAEKRAVGYKYDTEAQVLARFEVFSHREFPGLATVTEASVAAWLTAAHQRGVKPATLQGLAAPIRELARWLGRHGVAGLRPAPGCVAPARLGTSRTSTPTPNWPRLFAQTDRCHYCCEGSGTAPGHAGVVPHDLRLRTALLRSPPAARGRRRHRLRGAAGP